jgi:predicted small integral membrane protein
MELAILGAQIVGTAGLAGWLTLGLWDNLRYPSMNETYTAEVLSMARLRAEYPEAYALVAHRAITDRRRQLLAFRAVVAVEALASFLLWAGTVALLLALAGAVAVESARAIAICGATAFFGIWTGFLVVGNHFNYWFCNEGAQNTHFQMTLWGIATTVLLTQG